MSDHINVENRRQILIIEVSLMGVTSVDALEAVFLDEGQVDAFGLMGRPCTKPVIVAV